ncbi:MAG TPA: hypothetical protein VHM19_17470 [Polyangiales bacterium]|jgi:hypothetical protein|nr:hypothetical protein [Polyangiales bacterium]
MPTTNQRRFAGLCITWDASALSVDPFAPVMPLDGVEPDREAGNSAPTTLHVRASAAAEPLANPAEQGAIPVLFHGKTRCFLDHGALVLWDGASRLRISPDGHLIEAEVHDSSLEHVFHFSSVSVMMALLLALRHHGLFHLHASACTWPDGQTWVIPGESSSGKSTLALAAFASGARWISDDALLLRVTAGTGTIELAGWARLIRLTTRTADAFPALRPLLTPCPAGSARDFELDPRAAFPGLGSALARPPITLIFPRIAEASTSRITPLDNAEAFGRALHACAWVASEHVPRRTEQLDALARLIAGARAFELHASARVLHDPRGAIDELRALLATPA